MKNVSVLSRSRLFLPGAGADPIWSEPESAPGPRTSGAGAAQKSGGSATLDYYRKKYVSMEIEYVFLHPPHRLQ